MSGSAPPSAEARVGSDVGRYRLQRLVGRGRTGAVYEALDTQRGRVVALRLFHPQLSRDPLFRAGLKRAVDDALRLDAANVVTVHELGEVDGNLYVDTQLIAGVNLRDLIDRDGPLTAERAQRITAHVAAALDAAHRSNVIHGDVRPDDILVDADDVAYLGDFGLAPLEEDAGLTAMSGDAGRYAYMAPERLDGSGRVSVQSDVYSLTCVLYEMLTGQPPFEIVNVAAVLDAHLTKPPPRPAAIVAELPAALDDVIARGMAKAAYQRFPTASALAEAAARALPVPRDVEPAEPAAPVPQTGVIHRERPNYLHDDAQFTVYPPSVARPLRKTPLLVFAHLAELPVDADPLDDPIAQVKRRAEAVLGERIHHYDPTRLNAAVAVPHNAEVTVELELPDFDVDAPVRTFRWVNAVEMLEFHVAARFDLRGARSRGRVLIYHGCIQLAEVPLAIKVDDNALLNATTAPPVTGRPFRKIFPSYSHLDEPIVVQFEKYVEALGDRYLRDVRELRAGEVWHDRLCELIDEADVFQLFWSRNAMESRFVTEEWSYALQLAKPDFIRPTYWEQPLPRSNGLPPEALGNIHFHPLSRSSGTAVAEPPRPRPVASPRPTPVAPPRPTSVAPPPRAPQYGAPSASPPEVDGSSASRVTWIAIGAAVLALIIVVALAIFFR